MRETPAYVDGLARVEPAPDAARGRRAVAARAVKAGEAVLRWPALSMTLHGEFRGRRCDHCFRSRADADGALKRCGRCRVVQYCGRACQQADWPDHRIECAARASLEAKLVAAGWVGEGALADGLLVGRCLRRPPPPAAPLSSEHAPAQQVAELETLHDRIDAAELERLKCLAAIVASIPKLLPESCGAGEALDALCRFRNNNFAIVDDLFVAIGAGVFPRGAALNHSCAPNCLLCYELAPGRAPVQVVKAMVDMPAGEELTHSYVELGLPRWQRQAMLHEHYGFCCMCPACTGGSRSALDLLLVGAADGSGAVLAQPLHEGRDDAVGDLPLSPPCAERDAALAKADALVRSALAEEDAEVELQRLEEACGLREAWLHRRHIEVQAAHAAAHTAAIAAQNWEAAERHCERLVEQYIEVYPEWHPISGLQMYTLGELKQSRGGDEHALKWCERARQVLALTHGESHAFVKDLEARLQELRAGGAYLSSCD